MLLPILSSRSGRIMPESNLSDAQAAKLIRFLRAGIKHQNTTQHLLKVIYL